MNITCEGCKKVHKVKRTPEIPKDVVSMGCNWCPDCIANDYYDEWYNRSDGDKPTPNKVPDNQLFLPFIANEIEKGIKELL